jgi:NAD(P)-dependent dehydrogenase (short-subunit alcohol dehydrogenase family)
LDSHGNNIAGKVAVITGASSGLGQAAARLLSAQGASVALGARRVDRLKSLADELTAAGSKALEQPNWYVNWNGDVQPGITTTWRFLASNRDYVRTGLAGL